jgi:exodeoxyribonuclease VII small subunit
MTPSSKDAPSTAQRAASYESAREVVARLEAGGLSLDESLTLWERGEKLAAICTRFLDGARERVEQALRTAPDSGAADAGGDEPEA